MLQQLKSKTKTDGSCMSFCFLFRERDDLLVALHTLRASQQEAKQKEWSACLQVKQAMAIAEEANLHKSRV